MEKQLNVENAGIQAYVDSVLEIKSKEACKEIGYEFDPGVKDIMVENLFYVYTINEDMSFSQVNSFIDQTVEDWKKDTKENYM